ncbi:hypothetical protein [Vibrio phage vB_VmeM-Yong XC32]|nr:hypothetical protein [Vibrio phage vB_VmeM-Yong XC31]QAX96326.1 hypothetical protein [Vibrio phage vB_VmeM-Yong XC32]QAX96644.1 hypothetical protein [Vibrio phage vB_VmeM-Yong MS31]QAX96962.1 hypothetical protein [Vibrio phage vB_VmeM-Yong MS32]
MPRIITPITESLQSIERRVSDSVIHSFLAKTAFKPKYQIRYEREIAGTSKAVRNLFTNNNGDAIESKYKTYVFAEVNERYLEDHVNISRWQNAYHPPTFHDKEHGILLKPLYSTALVEMTLRIRCSSQVELTSWLNDLRITHGSSNLNWRHDIDYEYDIPHDFIDFLGEAWRMKQNVMPDEEELGDYLRRCFRHGVQKRQSQNMEHTDLIMVEKQDDVLGLATDEFFYNEKAYADGIYEVTINYRYEYKKPTALTIEVPATVRNQTIPKRFIQNWIPAVEREDTAYRPLYHASQYDEEQNPMFVIGDGGSRMREWDDWFPQDYNQHTQTVSILPIKVSQGAPTKVFNIWDIPDKYVPQAIKQYLKDFPEHKGHYPFSLVTLEVFAVGETEEQVVHSLDPNGDITVWNPLDPRKRNYLRISLLKDIARYNARETEKLLKMPEKAIELFKLYDPDVRLTESKKEIDAALPGTIKPGAYKHIPSILYNPNGTGITARSFTYWLRKLPTTNKLFMELAPRGGSTVQFFNISVDRR